MKGHGHDPAGRGEGRRRPTDGDPSRTRTGRRQHAERLEHGAARSTCCARPTDRRRPLTTDDGRPPRAAARPPSSRSWRPSPATTSSTTAGSPSGAPGRSTPWRPRRWPVPDGGWACRGTSSGCTRDHAAAGGAGRARCTARCPSSACWPRAHCRSPRTRSPTPGPATSRWPSIGRRVLIDIPIGDRGLRGGRLPRACCSGSCGDTPRTSPPWPARPRCSAAGTSCRPSTTGGTTRWPPDGRPPSRSGSTVASTAVAGAMLARLRLRSGSLLAPILVHAGINAAGLLAAHLVDRRRRRREPARQPRRHDRMTGPTATAPPPPRHRWIHRPDMWSGVILAGALATRTFQPSLMPRATAHQALVSGASGAIGFGIGNAAYGLTTHTGSTAGDLAAGHHHGGGFALSRLPQREHEGRSCRSCAPCGERAGRRGRRRVGRRRRAGHPPAAPDLVAGGVAASRSPPASARSSGDQGAGGGPRRLRPAPTQAAACRRPVARGRRPGYRGLHRLPEHEPGDRPHARDGASACRRPPAAGSAGGSRCRSGSAPASSWPTASSTSCASTTGWSTPASTGPRPTRCARRATAARSRSPGWAGKGRASCSTCPRPTRSTPSWDAPGSRDPIRVFVGYAAARTDDERVDLAMDELRRTGAFDRQPAGRRVAPPATATSTPCRSRCSTTCSAATRQPSRCSTGGCPRSSPFAG